MIINIIKKIGKIRKKREELEGWEQYLMNADGTKLKIDKNRNSDIIIEER